MQKGADGQRQCFFHIRNHIRTVEDDHKASLSEYIHILKWYFTGKLQIDYDAAYKWLDEWYQRNVRYIKDNPALYKSPLNEIEIIDGVLHFMKKLVHKIATNDFEMRDFTVCQFGHRLHGIFTYMMKELRNFITYDSQRLVSIDVKNSQPFMSTFFMNKNFWQSKNVKKDRLQLYEAAQDIYSRIGVQARRAITLGESGQTLAGAGLQSDNFQHLLISGQFYERMMEYFQANVSLEFKVDKPMNVTPLANAN